MSSSLLVRAVRNGPGPGPAVDVLVRHGRIVEISPSADSPDVTDVIDGAGAVLLPGLRDAHVHFSQWSIARRRIDVSSARSATQAASLMASAATGARRSGGAAVLTGFGFRDGLWPDTPHRDLLERVLPGRPAVLISQDLHCAWFSSAALSLAGVEHETGLLREGEAFAAVSRLPEGTADEVDRWALDAAAEAATRGVTEILDFEFTDTAALWRRRFEVARSLDVRVSAAIYRPTLDRVIDDALRTGDPVPGTNGLVTVGPCKVLMDGSLNTRTALCHDPYPGVTGSDANGLLTQDPEELTDTMIRAGRRGITFAVHAIGDRANTLALDCFERAGTGGRIEHAQMVLPEDLPRFGRLGVVAGIQPAHAVEDRDVADTHWRGRTEIAYPCSALVRAGATVEFGSDAPVSRLDPWYAIAMAANRTSDERPPWHPEQAISVERALAASTGGRTRLRVGEAADLVIVEQDPTVLDPTEVRDIPVLATVVGGRVTHRSAAV